MSAPSSDCRIGVSDLPLGESVDSWNSQNPEVESSAHDAPDPWHPRDEGRIRTRCLSSNNAFVGEVGWSRWRVRMAARSPHEAHRAATPLELFFDLVFVVAIAQAASGLHHAVAETHAVEGLFGYVMVFFAIWWAWMDFTWFASAYDTDDVPYRLPVFVQIAGALILAAGCRRCSRARTPNIATIGGYVVMRLALVVQWLRAAASDPQRRTPRGATRSASRSCRSRGSRMLFVPQDRGCRDFSCSPRSNCSVPMWAERARADDVASASHRRTLRAADADRAGRVDSRGEHGVQSALAAGEVLSALVPLIVGGLLIVYSMWWVYFDRPVHDLLDEPAQGVRLGLRTLLRVRGGGRGGCRPRRGGRRRRRTRRRSARSAPASAVAVPVATYLVCLWVLHDRPEYRRTRVYGPVAAVLVLLTPFTGYGVPLIGVYSCRSRSGQVGRPSSMTHEAPFTEVSQRCH